MNYCIDPSADEPIMLINREIGSDYGMIDGALFQEELLMLDTMGKKRIQVWINSPGGEVISGMNIYNAIQKSKTPVDTYNVGIAASTAGFIFMAGRNRYMVDYARLMMHPVHGVSDSKAYESFTGQLVSMLQSKSKCTEDEVKQMVTTTSWLTASQCLEKGFATHIENSRSNNSKYAKMDANALFAAANNLILSNNKNSKSVIMKKVANLLNLNEEANEASIESAVKNLIDANNKLVQERTKSQSDLTAAENTITKLNADLAEEKRINQEAVSMIAENNAKAMVDKYKSRIGDKPETVKRWVDLAKNDMDGTKEMLEALPVNVKSEDIETGKAGAGGSAAQVMMEIKNRIANNK